MRILAQTSRAFDIQPVAEIKNTVEKLACRVTTAILCPRPRPGCNKWSLLGVYLAISLPITAVVWGSAEFFNSIQKICITRITSEKRSFSRDADQPEKSATKVG